jgi:predicted membrane channel-forming protein YqfA (hemolysin III family)
LPIRAVRAKIAIGFDHYQTPFGWGMFKFMKKIVHGLTLLFSALMFLFATAPAFAQEGETATTQPAGIGILILLMGVLALLLVGGTYLTQNSTRKSASGTSADPDDEDDFDE